MVRNPVLLIVLAFSLGSCDHPYTFNDTFVGNVNGAVATLGVRSVSPSSCVPTATTRVTVSWDNPREVPLLATVTSADDALTGVPEVLSCTSGRLDFTFTPSASAAGQTLQFRLTVVSRDTRRPLMDRPVSLVCQAVGTPTHTIVYDLNGGSGGIPTSGASYSEGTTLVVESGAELTRAGYRWLSWNTRADGSGTDYPAGSALVLSSDTVLYAQWVKTYTITYNANGGSGVLPADSGKAFAEGSSLVVGSAGGLSRAGYLVVGWNSKPDASGRDFDEFDQLILTQDWTLYAIWVGSYTVTFDQNGGTGLVLKTVSQYLGQPLTIDASPSMTYPGRRFTNWNTEADGSGTDVPTGVEYRPDKDVTLYAQWRNASLDSALETLVGGGDVFLTGSFTEEDWLELAAAVRGASEPLNLDLWMVSTDGLPAGVFQNCGALATLVLPDTLATLPAQALGGCGNLTNLTLGDNLQTIAAGAVENCTNLMSLIIPPSVIVLEGGCFRSSGMARDGGSLQFLRDDVLGYYEGNKTTQDCYFGTAGLDIFGFDALSKNTSAFTILVPASAEADYEGLPLMSRYSSKIQS